MPLLSPLLRSDTQGRMLAALYPEILANVPGIDEAYLFESWAARYEGKSGADPNDIDVVAMGILIA